MSTVILGGGLSGLSAAHYLLKKNPKHTITLIESSSRTGGWIKSHLQQDGTIFEQGPRTIRPKGEAGKNTLHLLEDLNLSEQIVPIVASHPAAKNRMIYVNGSLHLLPSSLGGFFKKQEPFSKPLVLHLLNDLKRKRKQVEDESIYDFAERRFGREIADYLISPMICGICAGNAREISVKFLLKELFRYEQEYGSISMGVLRNFSIKKQEKLGVLASRAAKEKWSIFSFVNGCETLPLALKKSISDKVDVKLNTSCNSITFENNQAIIQCDNGTITANNVISGLPVDILGRLLHQHPDLATKMKNLVKNVSVAVVNLQFKSNFLKNQAFGLLVAPKENRPILGIIYDSCCFPNENSSTVLTVMMGGHWFRDHFGKNPSEKLLLETAVGEVQEILQTNEAPYNYKVNTLHNCLPQYIVGHNENLDFINSYISKQELPIFLCGASYNGVGINDVILSAKKAVNKIN